MYFLEHSEQNEVTYDRLFRFLRVTYHQTLRNCREEHLRHRLTILSIWLIVGQVCLTSESWNFFLLWRNVHFLCKRYHRFLLFLLLQTRDRGSTFHNHKMKAVDGCNFYVVEISSIRAPESYLALLQMTRLPWEKLDLKQNKQELLRTCEGLQWTGH